MVLIFGIIGDQSNQHESVRKNTAWIEDRIRRRVGMQWHALDQRVMSGAARYFGLPPTLLEDWSDESARCVVGGLTSMYI